MYLSKDNVFLNHFMFNMEEQSFIQDRNILNEKEIERIKLCLIMNETSLDTLSHLLNLRIFKWKITFFIDPLFFKTNKNIGWCKTFTYSAFIFSHDQKVHIIKDCIHIYYSDFKCSCNLFTCAQNIIISLSLSWKEKFHLKSFELSK